jgi:hypothetical protein
VSIVTSDFIHKLDEPVPDETLNTIQECIDVIVDGPAAVHTRASPTGMTVETVSFRDMATKFTNHIMQMT